MRPGQIPAGTERGSRVTIVDDDRDIAELIRSVLVDEGYQVTSVHHDLDQDRMRALLVSTRPDCVLLDGLGYGTSYGGSWQIAAWLGSLEPTVPVVMVTAYVADAAEAKLGTSVRARDADFAAVVAKPFDLDDLLAAVSGATRTGEDRRTADAETPRTADGWSRWASSPSLMPRWRSLCPTPNVHGLRGRMVSELRQPDGEQWFHRRRARITETIAVSFA